jgi:DNA polymerase-3 subunit beta
MKTSVAKSDLVVALKLVAKAKGKNSVLPIIEEYLIHVLPTKMTVVAGNLDVFVEYDIPGQNSDVFSFMMGEQQVKLIDKMGDVIDFEFDGFKLTVSSGKDVSKANPFPVGDYPKIKSIDNTTPFAIKNTKLFVDQFEKAKRFASTDDLRPAITGINLAFNSGKLEICATDGHKLYVANFDVTGNDEDGGLICKTIVSTVLSAIKTVFSISILRGVQYALFEVNGNIRITSRIIDERYPNYKAVIPEHCQSSKLNKKQLLTSLDKALLFANKVTHQIRFKFFKDNANISTADLDYNTEFKTDIAAENCDIYEEFEIGFNGKFLTSLVKEIDSDTVTLLTSIPNRPATIKVDNELYLIMPVMLGEY